jgi:septation ring formation regulator EzrA
MDMAKTDDELSALQDQIEELKGHISRQDQSYTVLLDTVQQIARKIDNLSPRKSEHITPSGGRESIEYFIQGQDRAAALFTNMFAQFRETLGDVQRAHIEGMETMAAIRDDVRQEILEESSGQEDGALGELKQSAAAIANEFVKTKMNGGQALPNRQRQPNASPVLPEQK